MKKAKHLLAGFLATLAIASVGQEAKSPVIGTWKGESLCTVKPSACHDEVVVYELKESADKKDALVMKADKVVDGKRQWMGDLDCTYVTATHVLNCEIPKGVWSFDVSGDTMSGTLKLNDGTLFRKVNVKRAK